MKELQKVVREMGHVADKVTITVCESDDLTMTSSGDMGPVVLIINPAAGDLIWVTRRVTRTYEATYFIKYIEKFLKGRLSEHVYIQVSEGVPMRLVYEIPEVGGMTMTIANIQEGSD